MTFFIYKKLKKCLYNLRFVLETTVSSSHSLKGQPTTSHTRKYDQMNNYNNQVELYRAFILSTGLNYAPKFLYCKNVENEKPVYVDSLEGSSN